MALDLPSGWMRQIISASDRLHAARPNRCRGFFWDSTRRHQVVVDLGKVNLTVPNVFRAVPLEDGLKNILSWEFGSLEEGTAPNMESISFFTDAGFSAEYPTKTVGQKESGFRCNTRTLSNRLDKTC